MEVRELGMDEAAVWRELKLAALQESPDAFRCTYDDESRLPVDAWERAVDRTSAKRPDLKLVAETGGRPVGIARVRLDDGRPPRAEVVLLWIRPEVRGRGAAGLLMECVLDWARDLGATLAELFVTEGNEVAADLYGSLGFYDSGVREPPREGSDRQSILMRRVLDPRLSDGRITLRPWSLDDVPEITAAIQDPAIERFRPEIPFPYSEEHAREHIESTRRQWEEGSRFDFAVTDRDAGELLGSVRVIRRSPGVWEVGYWVKRDARGRGVATRSVRLAAGWAFERLDVVRLQLRTDVDNPASQKVAERSGFIREGVLRAAGRLRTGELGDVVMYSLLRSEADQGGETS